MGKRLASIRYSSIAHHALQDKRVSRTVASSSTKSCLLMMGLPLDAAPLPSDYRCRTNRNTKVLDFVQLGGPKGTVRGTTFELVVPL